MSSSFEHMTTLICIHAYCKVSLFFAGYDFLSTTEFGLGINVLYNSTYNDKTAYSFIAALRVPRLVNAVCALLPINSYLANFIVFWNLATFFYFIFLSYRYPTHISNISEDLGWKCDLNM
jgi:hypothetical protein